MDHQTEINEKGLSRFFAQKAAFAFLNNVLGTFIAFLLHVIATRILGSEIYGDYIYVFSWLSLISLASQLGLNGTVVKYVAAYKAQEKWPELCGIIKFSNRVSLGVSIVSSALFLTSAFIVRDNLSENLFLTFVIGAFLIPVYTVINMRQAILRAMLHVIRANFSERVLKPIVLVTLLVTIYIARPEWLSAPAVMLLDGISILISMCLGMYWLFRLTPEMVLRSSPVFHSVEWLKMSVPLFFMFSVNLMLTTTDILMIGYFITTEYAGFYSVAFRVVSLISFGLLAVNSILAPLISNLHSTGKLSDLKRITWLSAWAIFAYAIVISSFLLLFGKSVLNLFGEQFSVAYSALVVLIIGQMINSMTGSVTIFMNMTGHHNKMAIFFVLSLALNVILNITFIPYYGLNGAAIASIASMGFCNISMCIWVYRNLNINLTVFQIQPFRRKN